MKKNSAFNSNNLGAFPSPGAPDYRERSLVTQKGWSSERIPAPTTATSSRRHIGATTSMPFDSGRTLPSKWEDAERWICSPNSGFGFGKDLYSKESHRRPKSKSGPLGPPGFGCNLSYSPVTPAPEGGSLRNFLVGSSFSTGVMVPGNVIVHSGVSGGVEKEESRSGNKLPEWSDFLSENSLPSSQDEKPDGGKNTDQMISPPVSRRDVATQMSPESSTCSSTNGRFSFCPSSPLMEPRNYRHSELEQIRDVQIDNPTTIIGWSKRNGARMIKNVLAPPPLDGESFDRNNEETQASSWNITNAAKNISKLQREEAKITAWENLQKAKAEAAMRKLEMKLEKKRSSSTDKILNKLKKAEVKAQERRSTLSVAAINEDDDDQVRHKYPSKLFPFGKNVRFCRLNSCFTFHAD